MKTRHFILAALALLCSTTLLTACGGDDDNGNPPAADNTRAYVGWTHSAKVTKDMLTYFNVEVITTDGNGKSTSYTVTEDKVTNDRFSVTVFSKLPGSVTVAVKVTVKSNVDFSTVESIKYYIAKSYGFNVSYFNADGKIIDGEGSFGSSGALSASTASVAGTSFIDDVRNGKLDYTVTFAFDKDGNRVVN